MQIADHEIDEAIRLRKEKQQAWNKAYHEKRRNDPVYREKQRLKTAAWYADPKNKAKQRERERRADVYAKKLACDRTYRKTEEGRKAKRALDAKWRRTEKCRLAKRDYAKTEKSKAQNKKWKQTIDGKASSKTASSTRKAKKRNAVIGDTSVIIEWEKRYRSMESVVCFWCLGSFEPDTCHSEHMEPISRGGQHCIENLCISCSPCNLMKHAKTLRQWNGMIRQPILL